MATLPLEIDPRGVIHESYRIEGISEADCRTIFLDWAMFAPESTPMPEMLKRFKEVYGAEFPNHPMTQVITEGLGNSSSVKRRGGRAARRNG